MRFFIVLIKGEERRRSGGTRCCPGVRGRIGVIPDTSRHGLSGRLLGKRSAATWAWGGPTTTLKITYAGEVRAAGVQLIGIIQDSTGDGQPNVVSARSDPCQVLVDGGIS